MNFYNHQSSYNTIDRKEIKRLLSLIANSKGFTTDCCSGWSTTIDYEATNKKAYELHRLWTSWNDERIAIMYKVLTNGEMKQRLLQLKELEHSHGIYECVADKQFKHYKVKIGFYKRHALNDEYHDYY